MTSESATPHRLLRPRDGHHARVTFEELFFDLVYVFAVTQLSHQLLHHLTFAGALETLILWFAVWLGWQYTCWITNWFNPETREIRGLLFASMLVGLVMASAIPEAFDERGLVFAAAYAAMQVGRSAFIVFHLGRDQALSANYRRILGWMLISAVFWLAGGFAHHEVRIVFWALAVLCEYIAPMIGFALPGLGRSSTRDWTIEGGHLSERCKLFVIVALGETLLASGAPLADTPVWDAPVLLALLSTFLGTLAMWWIYFGISGEDATATITGSDDPGRIGAYFHYIHVIFIAGVIVTAVSNDLVLAHPHGMADAAQVAIIVAGPAIFLLGSAVYKKVVYDVVPASHLVGALLLVACAPLAAVADLLMLGGLTTLIMLGVGYWEMRLHRVCPAVPGAV